MSLFLTPTAFAERIKLMSEKKTIEEEIMKTEQKQYDRLEPVPRNKKSPRIREKALDFPLRNRRLLVVGSPNGNRTRVTSLKARCPSH